MDIISFNEAATANGRIEKFIENPDSNSGIVTVPKVIGAGENITVPAGRVAVLPNVQVDGTLNIEGEVFIPSGSAINMGNGLAINGEKVVMSVPTSYHLLQGNLAVDNTVITQGFNTTLYTGNGSTQSINTGIDMATQWGSTTEEKFGGLVWLKQRSGTQHHNLFDSTRAIGNRVYTNLNYASDTSPTTITSFNDNGFSLSTDIGTNTNAATYASWNFQTTHRISGVTNHGKAYTCHYNPYTGFTIVKYEGSGIVGHEIPHHLGRTLGFSVVKNLTQVADWMTNALSNNTSGILGWLNKTDTMSSTTWTSCTDTNFTILTQGTANQTNTSSNQYIMYGWVNSYKDSSGKLIGNYEVGVYQGTGVAGNKVTTRGKPAWVMIKRLDVAEDWRIWDNVRDTDTVVDHFLYPNLSSVEVSGNSAYYLSFKQDGFSIDNIANGQNASGGQYLYMVAYDTNSDGGGSYYPKTSDIANVQINNALIPIAKGSDINGLKNVMLSKNETITGLTYTAGKNYIYYDGDGNKGVKSIAPNYGTTNPTNGGDFYNVLENKWYTSADVEIPEGRNYLNHIVHADNDGGVLYVEELPKIEYKDVIKANIIKANEYQGKNACTAWVNFDGTTTPVTIRDSYNVSKVIRTATGIFDVYFKKEMDNINYSVASSQTTHTTDGTINDTASYNGDGTTIKFTVITKYVSPSISGFFNRNHTSLQVFGGKN